MNSKNIIIVVVVAAVFAAGGFFGGIKYQQGKAASAATAARANFAAGSAGGFGRRGGAGGAAGGGFVTGQLLSMDSSSVTIKLPNNAGTKIVFYSGSTQISQPQPVQATELKTGENLVITGTPNSDGSVTAQSIQVRPAMAPTSTQAGAQ